MVATLSAAILSYRSCQRRRTDILKAAMFIFVAYCRWGFLIEEDLDALSRIGFWPEETIILILSELGMPQNTKSTGFLNIVQNAFDPPSFPFKHLVKVFLAGVFF